MELVGFRAFNESTFKDLFYASVGPVMKQTPSWRLQMKREIATKCTGGIRTGVDELVHISSAKKSLGVDFSAFVLFGCEGAAWP